MSKRIIHDEDTGLKRSQEEVDRADALQQLAVLGGKLTKSEDITFRGTKFVLPEHLDLEGAIEVLEERREAEETVNRFVRAFNYRPMDGAIATGKAIRQACGFTLGKTLYSFFGRTPPTFIDVEVGFNKIEQAPWGAMQMPGLENTVLYLGNTKHPQLGMIFELVIEAPLKYKHHVEGLFILVQEFLDRESIYRGKAVTSEGEFIDISGVDASKLVYADSVQRRLEGDLWSFIRYEDQLAAEGQSGKYAVLLEGPYGSGKTEAAGVTAQIAVEHGWTFITARPGRDELQHALELARLYQPAIVFAEDVDNDANPARETGLRISQMLDQMDGFHVKGQKLIVVFTTNHADRIHKGMLRPGRIGAVIHVGAIDAAGVEKLTKRIVGASLADDVDFVRVAQSMDGYMPAFVREALNRAVRYTISNNGGVMGKIGTTELCDAADGLRDQLNLMNDAPVDQLTSTLSQAFGAIVQQSLEGTGVFDDDDDKRFYLSSQKA